MQNIKLPDLAIGRTDTTLALEFDHIGELLKLTLETIDSLALGAQRSVDLVLDDVPFVVIDQAVELDERFDD